MTTDRKRPGRPPLHPDDPSVSVNVKLPATVYDAVYVRAKRQQVSVPELIRRSLRDATDDTPTGPPPPKAS